MGIITLLEDISTGNSENIPKKAVLNTTFKIDEDGNKTFEHKPLHTNTGELLQTLSANITSDYNSRFNFLKCMPNAYTCRKVQI